MKLRIGNKRYDTETARLVGGWSNDRPTSDFRYRTEELYLKHTGEFFLYGEGGAATMFADVCDDDSTCFGWCITPVSRAKSRIWARHHLSEEEYVSIFGEKARASYGKREYECYMPEEVWFMRSALLT